MKITYEERKEMWVAAHYVPSKALGVSSDKWLAFRIKDRSLERLKKRLGPAWAEFMEYLRDPL